MDRFAFKIDKALKANLYKICRLCGIDNPDQVPIIQDVKPNDDIDADDPEISLKIRELIGFTIRKDDKMPQSICGQCLDKINDFYEFRDMCYATNVQTRNLLGLKPEDPHKYVVATAMKTEIKEEPSNASLKKARKRKSDEDYVPGTVMKNEKTVTALHKKLKTQKQPVAKKGTSGRQVHQTQQADQMPLEPKVEIKEEPPLPEVPTKKLRHPCSICDERFPTKAKLERHRRLDHVPNISRYVCSTCDVEFNRKTEIATHQLWHKLSRTPFTCALCGDRMLSSYVYARHLREHCSEEKTASLLVLDRTCPHCQHSFPTNYLYNMHPCAVETNICPGCCRRTWDAEDYMRHLPQCEKVYLTHSQHVKHVAGIRATESIVRIKNENEIEAAEAAASLGLSLDVTTPYVSLVRLSSPVLMAANQCVAIPAALNEQGAETSHKKGKKLGKRGVTKEDIRRVDDLLKSTLDTLVSIKHEPEVCMESDDVAQLSKTQEAVNEALAATSENDDEDEDYNSAYNADDHHQNASEDDDENESVFSAVNNHATVESIETNAACSIQIKQEPDESHDKVPVLKLKISKAHGTLNSSLVDEENVGAPGKRSEKKKKKKKHKDMDREKHDKEHKSPSKVKQIKEELTSSILLSIKPEPLDNCEPMKELNVGLRSTTTPPPAAMTLIPMAQFQISAISSAVAMNDSAVDGRTTEELVDVKPNRLELDRLLNIANERQLEQAQKPLKATARKSTAALCLPQIAAVSTLAMPPSVPENMLIKAEPLDSGYGDAMSSTDNENNDTELSAAESDLLNSSREETCSASAEADKQQASNNNAKRAHVVEVRKAPRSRKQSIPNKICMDAAELNEESQSQSQDAQISEAEAAYINSIDFNNLQIKQEKPIDLYDVQADYTQLPLSNGKGAKKKRRKKLKQSQSEHNVEGTDEEETEASDDYSSESDENEDVGAGTFEAAEEIREYRELELPPLLQQPVNNNNDVVVKDINNGKPESEAAVQGNGALNLSLAATKLPAGLNETAGLSESNLKMQISSVSSGCSLIPEVPIKTEPLDYDYCDAEPEAMPFSDNINSANPDTISVIQNALGLEIRPMSIVEKTANVPRDSVVYLASTPTIQVKVESVKETELDARPVNSNESISDQLSTDESDVDEVTAPEGAAIEIQQNIVNAAIDTLNASTTGSISSYCDNASTSASTSSKPTPTPDVATEEADNLNNETLAAAIQQVEEAQNLSINNHPAHTAAANFNISNNLALNDLILDYSNINEIAENNNNANIERELQDDHAADVNMVNNDGENMI